MKGLSHLETEHPCRDWGPKCWKCRFAPWCLTFRERPPKKEE